MTEVNRADVVTLVDGLPSFAEDAPGAAELRAQLRRAIIGSSCDCGCGSAGFEFDDPAEVRRAATSNLFPVEGEVLDATGQVAGGLLLFVRDGLLSDLDVFSYGDPLPLPAPSAVRWVVRRPDETCPLTAISGPEADSLAQRLRAEGWAAHVDIERLVRSWEQLASEVNSYVLTIDDYTNDLTARDALTIVLSRAEGVLRSEIEKRVTRADRQFRSVTADDGGAAVGRYFRVGTRDGWWWRRRPTAGPFAEWLDRQIS